MSAHNDRSGGHDYRCDSSSAPPRRDTPVTCIACGKRVRRKGRKQKYCSRRCRQRDYWDRCALAKISAVVTHDTGRSTTPQKSSSNVNGLGRQKSQRTGFGKAPLNLLGGGSWCWPGTPTLDTVVREKIRRTEIGGRFVQLAPAATTMMAPATPRPLFGIVGWDRQEPTGDMEVIPPAAPEAGGMNDEIPF
jgi:endogenous inhibitor of DNA gyrase (YacG/DUF329 family)